MKKILQLIIFTVFVMAANAQNCSDLFISKYLEGTGNNKAIELYNPTPNAIDLSGYSLGRFSNGSTSFTGIQLPQAMIQPYGTYVYVIDKRDSLGTGFEVPVWNGYQLVDTLFDQVTNEPILDSAGNVIFGVQFDSERKALFGTTYHEYLDLQSRADTFICPVYDCVMYFNGNDAVALVAGSAPSGTGDNIIDVIGVIGALPLDAQGNEELGWVDANGYWVTRNSSLVRQPYIEKGTGLVASATLDTFDYSQWQDYPNNRFTILDGTHDCSCDPNFVNTSVVNAIPFQVYPNPTEGRVVIEAQEMIQAIEVYNIMGQAIKRQQLVGTNYKQDVNLEDLQTGMYILQVYFDGNQRSVQKIMIR